MALFITQCPHCHTTFRTSVSQLQSADGMVRCGACLRIFVADDHLLPSADLQTLDKPLGAANDSDESDALAAPTDIEPENTGSSTDDSQVPEVPEPLFTFVEPEATAEPSDSDVDVDTGIPNRHADFALQQDRERQAGAATEDLPPLVADAAAASAADTSAGDLPAFSALDDFAVPAKAGSADSTSELSRQHLDTIAAAGAALEFDWEGNAGQKSRSAWWIFFAALLFSTLGLQAIYVTWDELGQNDAVRPWLDRLCSTLPCVLEKRVDLRAIRTENLLVHSHPEIANALRVTLILRNDSPFDQALPLLNLRFTDAGNSAVAERQFSPADYLPGDLQHLDSLPAGTPVQVSLDIIDPGIRAINYEVSFSAGETP